MTRTEIIAKLAELPSDHWKSACARLRWCYKRYKIDPFDLDGMPPALVEFAKKEPPPEAWVSLRTAVTKRRRAETVKLQRADRKAKALKVREYNRTYMAEYRKRMKERAHG